MILLVCGVLTFPIYKDFLLHDYALARYVRAFRKMQHPANTSFVSFKKKLGILWGNGNHCNYFAGELRHYNGGRREIESFYAGQTAADSTLTVQFVENGEFPGNADWWLPYDLAVLSAWLDSPDAPRDNLYLVSIWGFDPDPGWDMRCY